jgi:hypothetical protein
MSPWPLMLLDRARYITAHGEPAQAAKIAGDAIRHAGRAVTVGLPTQNEKGAWWRTQMGLSKIEPRCH